MPTVKLLSAIDRQGKQPALTRAIQWNIIPLPLARMNSEVRQGLGRQFR